MFRLLLLTALVAVSAHLAVGKLTEDISTFYHTSEQLMQEYEALRAASCPIEISSRKHGNTELPFVRIASSNPSPPHRVLLFFGEHARELISTEAGLGLAKQLCNPDPDVKSRVQELLSQADVSIFPNINVDGRKRVEQGEYCVRSNRRKVDLNRNWASHWEHASKSALASEMKAQSWGGSSAFSEDETQILKNESDQLRPTVFITVHSGILGLYMPYAYNGKLPSNARDSKSLMHILNRLNKQYCACQAGPAGKEVGYLCPGTCLDYMYDTLHTRYSFGFEIYDGETNGGFSNVKTAAGDISNSSYANDKLEAQLGATSFLEVAFKNGMSPSNKRSEFWTTAEPHSEEYYRQMLDELDEEEEEREDADLVLLQTAYSRGKRRESSLSPSSSLPAGGAFPQPDSDKRHKCLASFNPVTKEAFDGTLHNWSRAFIDTVMLSMEDAKR